MRKARPSDQPSGGRSKACAGRSNICSTTSNWARGGRHSAAHYSSRSDAARWDGRLPPSTLSKGEGVRDHGGTAGDGRKQHRRQILRRHLDDQRRETGGKGREEEGLLPLRTPLWLVPAFVQRAGRRR